MHPVPRPALACLAALLAALPGGAIADTSDGPPRPPRFDVDPDQPPATWVRQPAPVLAPADSIASFDLPPGYRAELVAAEPIVQDPIAIAFHPDGRIWVIEYPAYNWEYRDQLNLPDKPPPGGRVVVLEDTSGDGLMDRRTVFLDNLDNPRALTLVGDGLLLGNPPELSHHRDTTGDDRADEHTVLHNDFGPLTTVHAQPSALLQAMDNWIYATRFTARMRWRDGQWRREPCHPSRGQWGMSQDNQGRLFFNTQADPLRADLIPPIYPGRNPHLPTTAGLDIRIAPDLRDPQPHDATPGVNQRWDGFLNEQGRLAHFTSACSPHIFRGDHLPDHLVGDAFVCVPAANFVRHYKLTRHSDGRIDAVNALAEEQREFLFAHDERFRPVQILTAPDGTLHVVDMYRGIIEGHTWISDITHDYILARKLNKPFNGLGRIYRIAHEDHPVTEPPPPLAGLPAIEWVEQLNHSNGWRRDTAQRLLVESPTPNQQPDPAVIEALTELATDRRNHPHGRLHALWTLEGLHALSPDTLSSALTDPAPDVRQAALRLAEPQFDHPDLLTAAMALADDPHPAVRRQLIHSLGEVGVDAADHAVTAVMRRILLQADDIPWMAEAAVSSLHRREPAFLQSILSDPQWQPDQPQPPSATATRLLELLAQAIGNSGQTEPLAELVTCIEQTDHWPSLPLLAGLVATRPEALARATGGTDLLQRLLQLPDPDLHPQAVALVAAIQSPPAAAVREPDLDRLNDTDRELFENGRAAALLCAACHQLDWQGREGVAPALIGSDLLNGEPGTLVRIVLGGYSERDDYPPMAALAALTDHQIAAILTYLRLSLGDSDTPVHPELIQQLRQQHTDRNEPWTLETLRSSP